MPSLSQILSEFGSLSWEDKIEAIKPPRKGIRKLQLGTHVYQLSKPGLQRLKREFRKQVCDFNRHQPIDQPIRSVFSGEFLTPGSSSYTRSLRICRLERIHSTCREILSQDPFPHPRSGAPVPRESVLGRALRRKCQ